MQRSLLKQIIIDQNATALPEPYIERQALSDLMQHARTQQIMVISGVRRCGKSALIQRLRQLQPQQSAYYLNFDDERLLDFELGDCQMLWELLIELYGEQDHFYFDEIQNVPGWERFVRRLQDNNKQVWVTGSNAHMLSRELGTHLTGRYIPTTLYPYSFAEFLIFKEVDHDINPQTMTSQQRAHMKYLFNEFLQNGGFPHYLHHLSQDYLQALYESILYRDIIVRYGVQNERALRELALFVASHIGKRISFNKLKSHINVRNAATVSDYCYYLESAYLAFFITRYDSSLKKQTQANKKGYLIDTALAQLIGFHFSEDRGRLLENCVLLELKRRSQGEIYYHHIQYECDFVIKQGSQITQAIQVTCDVSDPQTYQREINGLIDAMQTYQLSEGWLLTEDEHFDTTAPRSDQAFTIYVRPVWEWLI